MLLVSCPFEALHEQHFQSWSWLKSRLRWIFEAKATIGGKSQIVENLEAGSVPFIFSLKATMIVLFSRNKLATWYRILRACSRLETKIVMFYIYIYIYTHTYRHIYKDKLSSKDKCIKTSK